MGCAWGGWVGESRVGYLISREWDGFTASDFLGDGNRILRPLSCVILSLRDDPSIQFQHWCRVEVEDLIR